MNSVVTFFFLFFLLAILAISQTTASHSSAWTPFSSSNVKTIKFSQYTREYFKSICDETANFYPLVPIANTGITHVAPERFYGASFHLNENIQFFIERGVHPTKAVVFSRNETFSDVFIHNDETCIGRGLENSSFSTLNQDLNFRAPYTQSNEANSSLVIPTIEKKASPYIFTYRHVSTDRSPPPELNKKDLFSYFKSILSFLCSFVMYTVFWLVFAGHVKNLLSLGGNNQATFITPIKFKISTEEVEIQENSIFKSKKLGSNFSSMTDPSFSDSNVESSSLDLSTVTPFESAPLSFITPTKNLPMNPSLQQRNGQDETNRDSQAELQHNDENTQIPSFLPSHVEQSEPNTQSSPSSVSHLENQDQCQPNTQNRPSSSSLSGEQDRGTERTQNRPTSPIQLEPKHDDQNTQNHPSSSSLSKEQDQGKEHTQNHPSSSSLSKEQDQGKEHTQNRPTSPSHLQEQDQLDDQNTHNSTSSPLNEQDQHESKTQNSPSSPSHLEQDPSSSPSQAEPKHDDQSTQIPSSSPSHVEQSEPNTQNRPSSSSLSGEQDQGKEHTQNHPTSPSLSEEQNQSSLPHDQHIQDPPSLQHNDENTQIPSSSASHLEQEQSEEHTQNRPTSPSHLQEQDQLDDQNTQIPSSSPSLSHEQDQSEQSSVYDEEHCGEQNEGDGGDNLTDSFNRLVDTITERFGYQWHKYASLIGLEFRIFSFYWKITFVSWAAYEAKIYLSDFRNNSLVLTICLNTHETHRLLSLRGPHIPKIIYAPIFYCNGEFYCSSLRRAGVPLTDYCIQSHNPQLEKMKIIKDIFKAIDFMHKGGFLFSTLELDHFEYIEGKIKYVGLNNCRAFDSKTLPFPYPMPREGVDSRFSSPEWLLRSINNRYYQTIKGNVFSACAFAYAILYRISPYRKLGLTCDEDLSKFPPSSFQFNHLSNQKTFGPIKEMLKQGLAYSPGARPSMEQILKHFANIRDLSLP